LVIFFGGEFLLSLFGTAYVQAALKLLQILAISSIPVAFNALYMAIERSRKRTKFIIYIYAFIALATIGGGYLLMQTMGIFGTGIAWLVSNLLVALIIVLLNFNTLKCYLKTWGATISKSSV
jgi:O-antigen/teichoic acid export membrane protein